MTIPSGLSIGMVGTSAHVQQAGGTGQTRTFTMTDLPPGATGAISVDLNIPGNETPDGTSWTWTAAATGTNTPSVTSNSVTITARAASDTTADARLLSGGAVGGLARYVIKGCNDRRTPFTTWGPLAVVTGSKLEVVIPAGATIIERGASVLTTVGGVRTLTWTFDSMGAGCATPEIVLEYPTSDSSNVVGASKQLNATWTGRLVGEASDHTLGTKTLIHALTAPAASVSPFKRVNTPRASGGIAKATINDTISYDLGGENTGTVTLDDFKVNDTFPDGVAVTELHAHNHGRQPGQLWIATRFGADGILGNADDGQLALNRTIPARTGVDVSFSSLAAQDAVLGVEMRASEIRPSEGGTYLTVRAKVLPESRSGVEATNGLPIENNADFTSTSTIAGTQSTDNTGKSATFEIDMPTAGLYVRNFGTTVPSGSRVTTQLHLQAAPVVDNDLLNPVFVLQLPPGLSIESWDGPSNLPAASMATLPNWAGTGDTLVRWTFPRGTVAQKGVTYDLGYKVRLARNIYSTRTVRGYINSASQPVTCYQNFFDNDPDADDRDGDGNTTEVLCPWFASIEHPTSSAAILTTSVKGQWDSQWVDAPGTGRSKPGGDDTYRVTLESQATMGLDRASIIDVLPRPGDTGVIGGAQRNPTSRTFPVVLRGRPTLPNLTGAVTTFYSTVQQPCRPEYGFSPAGCNAPNWTDWDASAPADVADVTAVKVDFGTNVLTPGDVWSVLLPVTTPTSGATEPDFAAVNPSYLLPANDEIAQHTAAFEVRRSDINATLLPSESQSVGLRMPSAYGPADQPVAASDRTSTGAGTEPQGVRISVPAGGSAKLVDNGVLVDQIVTPGVGTYTIDPQTGDLRFVPEPGYVGTPPAVTYRRTTIFGTFAQATYTPTVTAPAGPTAPAKTSTGVGTTPQAVTLPTPTGGSVRLLDGTTPVTELTVANEGRYVLDPATGKVTFTPVRGFKGQATPVRYQITDAYGSHDESTYTPAVEPQPEAEALPATQPAATSALETQPAAASAPATCFSRREMTINWKIPRGMRLKSVRIALNGKQVLTLKGSVRRVTVDLKGRPKQNVDVLVLATTTTGKKIGTTRTYRTCRTKRKQPPLATLRLLPVRR